MGLLPGGVMGNCGLRAAGSLGPAVAARVPGRHPPLLGSQPKGKPRKQLARWVHSHEKSWVTEELIREVTGFHRLDPNGIKV